MKKRLLFICFQDIKKTHGISNKIVAQKGAFNHNGFNAQLAYVHLNELGNWQYKIDNECIGERRKSNKTFYRLFYSYSSFSHYIKKNHIKYAYIRLIGNSSFGLLLFLFKIKLCRVKIIAEIPTYPYDKETLFEGQGFLAQLPNKVDRILRHFLFIFVSSVVTYSDDKKIWNIPCINISNGYIPEQTRIKKYVPIRNVINLIAVAYVQKWHGFDRIIEGIHQYLLSPHKMDIHLTIVGDGDLEELRFLVEKYKLQQNISFTGALSGEALDAEFDKAHIAIGSLGRHRSGLSTMRSLKNVEYAARGIGFVYSESNQDFDNQQFVLKVPADESPLDINKVIIFAQNLSMTPQEIHQYALPFSWDNQIQKVALKY